MENENSIHIDIAYKTKTVKVHLEFSEEQDNGNAEAFYDGLKKIYLEKLITGS